MFDRVVGAEGRRGVQLHPGLLQRLPVNAFLVADHQVDLVLQDHLGGDLDATGFDLAGSDRLNCVVLGLQLLLTGAEILVPGPQGQFVHHPEGVEIRQAGAVEDQDLLRRGVEMKFLPTAVNLGWETTLLGGARGRRGGGTGALGCPFGRGGAASGQGESHRGDWDKKFLHEFPVLSGFTGCGPDGGPATRATEPRRAR